jgi:hypothetical protein
LKAGIEERFGLIYRLPPCVVVSIAPVPERRGLFSCADAFARLRGVSMAARPPQRRSAGSLFGPTALPPDAWNLEVTF